MLVFPACSQIASILTHIAADQHLTVAPGLAQTIAEESSRNLRRAILMMEAAKVKLSVASISLRCSARVHG